jgi:precorrin-6B methylase 1
MLNPIEFPDGTGMQQALHDARVLERLLTSMEAHWVLPDATSVSLVCVRLGEKLHEIEAERARFEGMLRWVQRCAADTREVLLERRAQALLAVIVQRAAENKNPLP